MFQESERIPEEKVKYDTWQCRHLNLVNLVPI